MSSLLVLKIDEGHTIKGRLSNGKASFEVGDFAVHLTEAQLREFVECGIDLLSDLNLGRLPGCEGSDLPPAERAA